MIQMLQTNWIAPRLTGGLGNRFFQTFAALAIAEETGRHPVFLLPRTSHCEHGAYEPFFTLFSNIPILQSAHHWVEVKEGEVIPDTKEGIVLVGLFQEIPLCPSLSSPFFPRFPRHLAPTKDVAVHFRFGDYSFLPHHQIHLTQYYKDALALFPDAPLCLFSDEPAKLADIAEEWRNNGRSVTIAENIDVLDTLIQIEACQGGFIGCNSTFGYWAAWFALRASGEHSTYKIIFPDTWMQPGYSNHKPPYITPLSRL